MSLIEKKEKKEKKTPKRKNNTPFLYSEDIIFRYGFTIVQCQRCGYFSRLKDRDVQVMLISSNMLKIIWTCVCGRNNIHYISMEIL